MLQNNRVSNLIQESVTFQQDIEQTYRTSTIPIPYSYQYYWRRLSTFLEIYEHRNLFQFLQTDKGGFMKKANSNLIWSSSFPVARQIKPSIFHFMKRV